MHTLSLNDNDTRHDPCDRTLCHDPCVRTLCHDPRDRTLCHDPGDRTLYYDPRDRTLYHDDVSRTHSLPPRTGIFHACCSSDLRTSMDQTNFWTLRRI